LRLLFWSADQKMRHALLSFRSELVFPGQPVALDVLLQFLAGSAYLRGIRTA
jgi:hypothetical protein